MTQEATTRQLIDQTLEKAGWVIQDMKDFRLSAGSELIAVPPEPMEMAPKIKACLAWDDVPADFQQALHTTGATCQSLLVWLPGCGSI